MIGPNCPGVLSPGKANVGIIPAEIFSAGSVGLVSRSGTLTYQIGHELTQLGLGNSTIVGIGGDPVVGSSFIDVLDRFEADPETELIVLVGEIGGDEEEKAAAYISEHVTKPVLAYIAGFSAPPGKTMGHAGAIISGSSGTAQAKKDALEAEGIEVGTTPTEVAQLVARNRMKSALRPPSTRRPGSAEDSRRWMSSPSRAAFPRPNAFRSPSSPTARARRSSATARRSSPTAPAAGYPPLREWIAARHGVDPARVVITSGSLQGFVLLAEQLVPRPARARRGADLRPAAQDPARASAPTIVGVPMDDDGLDPAALERALATARSPRSSTRSPTFQNPSGRTLSAERRRARRRARARARPARARGRPVRARPLRGRARCRRSSTSRAATNVVYASSFSKTIAPGVRVGYFVLPPALAAQIEALAVSTYISPPFMTQATVYEFLRRGNFEPNLERVTGC